MTASSSDAATAAELRVRLDAGTRQADTLSLLMEREVAQMAAMERRAAVVVDDWSVLEAARAIMDAPQGASDDGDRKAAHTVPHINSDDRNRVATSVTDYEAAVEAADWESLPHTKLICGIPLVVFQVEIAADIADGVDDAAEQPHTVARKLDTSAATEDAVHVVVVDVNNSAEAATAAEAEVEADERLDSDAKIDQVGQFREAAEASQEQLRVLSELLEHEQSSIASLKRLLADVDPDFAREQPHHRRFTTAASRKVAPYVLDGTRTEGDSATADLRRMHSTNDARLPAVQRALRLVGGARTRDSSNVLGDRWREAVKIAESLRSQFVARSAAHAAHVANDEEGAKDAAQVCKEIEKVSDVKTAKQLLEVTEELEFAIRAAAGLKAKRRHTVSGRARSIAASSRQSSVGPGDAILAHSAARASGAAADGQSSAHHDDETNTDEGQDDDDDDVSSGAIIEELQNENSALKVRIAELEDKTAESEEKATAAESDATTAREEATTAQGERDDLKEKLDEVERFLAESREAIEAIQEEQRLTEEAHKQALADADACHDETRDELAKANDRLKNLQGVEESIGKWRETEKELSRVAEAATDAHYAMRSELDATNVKLSTLEVRAARDQLIAKEARARLAATVDEFGEAKKDSRTALDACAADNAELREAIECAKMEHADELEQQREAAAEATVAQMVEITRLQDELADTQQRLEGAEARLAAIRKARMDKRFGSPTSAYSRSRARGNSIENDSFRSASTAGPASPIAGDLLHAASMPAFHSAQRRISAASPRTANLSYFAASPRRTSDAGELNEAARAPAAAGEGNTAASSPEPRTSSATMLWPADSEVDADEPEPSRVPDMVLDHARTAALLRQWEFEQKNRPRV